MIALCQMSILSKLGMLVAFSCNVKVTYTSQKQELYEKQGFLLSVQIIPNKAQSASSISANCAWGKCSSGHFLFTVFPRIDTAAFIYFVGQLGAATIRGRRLFEGGVYSFRQYDPRRAPRLRPQHPAEVLPTSK